MLPIPPLRLAALFTLATQGFAAVVGLIAVIDADAVQSAVAVGVGVALTVFAAGATIVCGLACLARGRLELPALAGVLIAGIAVDLLALAIWLEIDSEAYGKVAGIAFVWTFFALIVLGLTLAVAPSGDLARGLYLGAVATASVAGLIATWLVATAGSVFGNCRVQSGWQLAGHDFGRPEHGVFETRQHCGRSFGLKGHIAPIAGLAFSPDGKRIASGASGRRTADGGTSTGPDDVAEVKIWNLATESEVLSIERKGSRYGDWHIARTASG